MVISDKDKMFILTRVLSSELSLQLDFIPKFFKEHYPDFYESEFNACCDDWGLDRHAKSYHIHFKKDLREALLTKSSCLILLSQDQFELAQRYMRQIEGYCERGVDNDRITKDSFIRVIDLIESCLEHLKSEVINYGN